MNYGVKATKKRIRAVTSRKKKYANRLFLTFFKTAFVLVLFLCVTGVSTFIGMFKGILDSSPDFNPDSFTPSGYFSTIYNSAGEVTDTLVGSNSNRIEASYEDFPQDLIDAFVSIEDSRFWQHSGIDLRSISRAVVGVLTNNYKGGASTLTQQLIKNTVFNGGMETSKGSKIERKIQEQYLALQLTKNVDRKVILTNYLNTINLGSNTLGVKAAALRYFNKNVSDLTLSECTVIAGITQNPTKFNPITNPESNQKRRKEVLQHMLDQNYISQEQYDEALADDVYSRIQAAQIKNSSTENTVYTYFEDELTDQIINDLMNIKGYTKTQATNLLYSGGLKVYTTQDSTIQNILDEEYADPSNYPDTVQYELDYALTVTDPDGKQVNYSKEMLQLYFQNENPDFDLLFDSPEEGQTYVDRYKANILADGSKVLAERVNFAPQPQSSMSVIDQHTGYVKALIGGRGEKTASLTLNRATDTTRQPGSTFKIVSTYAPALNEKGMSLATTFEDEPYEYPDGSPVNNATRSYNGTTTIRTAIQNSINVVAVKCLEKVTPELGLKYLDNFGFTTLAHGTEADKDANGNVWSDANLATALGGITRGVTNVELCASYAAIANGGNYIKPIYYTKILDHNGNVLIENTSAERSVIKESTAYLLTSAMEDVVKKGTGTACQLDNMPVAGKTGTTEAYNDLWFVGYTPYYTCAVWSGYDNNEKLPDYARNFHKALWKKVMTRIHEGLPSKEFEKPASVEKLSVCEETGLLPRAGCPVITEYFDVGTMPTEYCDQHFYDSDDYDYNYDEDSSDQTDSTAADTDNTETPDSETTDSNDNSDTTDDNNNNEDNSDSDNTDGSDDNSSGSEDDSSYQIDYY